MHFTASPYFKIISGVSKKFFHDILSDLNLPVKVFVAWLRGRSTGGCRIYSNCYRESTAHLPIPVPQGCLKAPQQQLPASCSSSKRAICGSVLEKETQCGVCLSKTTPNFERKGERFLMVCRVRHFSRLLLKKGLRGDRKRPMDGVGTTPDLSTTPLFGPFCLLSWQCNTAGLQLTHLKPRRSSRVHKPKEGNDLWVAEKIWTLQWNVDSVLLHDGSG